MFSNPNVFWPLLISVACGSFLLGVRVESHRWRQRCNDALKVMETMKHREYEV